MRERPIAFSGPMVRALLAGTKTQTRRAVKPPPRLVTHPECAPFLWWNDEVLDSFRCPYGQPGDRLWVREDHHITLRDARAVGVRYLADGSSVPEITIGKREYDLFVARKRPNATTRGRFMWRCLSRIELELTEVRVERLHGITGSEAQAEGVFFKDYGRRCGHHGRWQPVGDCPAPESTHPQLPGWSWRETSSHEECLDTARGGFANLWKHVNGPGSWSANPWVWVLEFRRVKP